MIEIVGGLAILLGWQTRWAALILGFFTLVASFFFHNFWAVPAEAAMMHELSKTGRWLGGTTPTGYASESLSSVTVDGKVKKACKLKPIPEEIQLVKTIFSVFMETGSLSKTDQYLLPHRDDKFPWVFFVSKISFQ